MLSQTSCLIILYLIILVLVMTVTPPPVRVHSVLHPPLITGKAISRSILRETFILAPECHPPVFVTHKKSIFLNLVIP